jgi:hypothetical protein
VPTGEDTNQGARDDEKEGECSRRQRLDPDQSVVSPETHWASGFFGIRRALSWTPKTCRYDPENPPKFSIWLNLLFSFVSTPCM